MRRPACGKRRALLEAVGLIGAQIAKYYSMHLLNEEESIQDGLQVWIVGGVNATWEDLLNAIETAGIATQQHEGLKEDLYNSTGDSGTYSCYYCMHVCTCIRLSVCELVCSHSFH